MSFFFFSLFFFRPHIYSRAPDAIESLRAHRAGRHLKVPLGGHARNRVFPPPPPPPPAPGPRASAPCSGRQRRRTQMSTGGGGSQRVCACAASARGGRGASAGGGRGEARRDHHPVPGGTRHSRAPRVLVIGGAPRVCRVCAASAHVFVRRGCIIDLIDVDVDAECVRYRSLGGGGAS